MTTPLSAGAAVRTVTRRGIALPAFPRLDSTLALLAIVLVLVGVIVLFRTFGDRAAAPGATAQPAAAAAGRAPNVVGQRLDRAIKAMRDAGFGVVAWDVAQGGTGKPCDVARQEPAAGADFGRGQRATLFYIAGKDCQKVND